MNAQTPAAGTASERDMRRVATAALAGTSIEWYDFFIYGTAAALVFPSVFFPADIPPYVALIASFSTFAVGFVARPVGGIVFGHFGDRIGRKKTLVTALLLMGVATLLIGLLPGYALIGPAAPIALILLRFAQGLAIGGQWGGAMLLVTENAPPHRRGFYGAFAQAGAPSGVVLANLAFLAVTGWLDTDALCDWGWRVPFIASVLLIGVSMYSQLRLEETPAFKALNPARAPTHAPIPDPTSNSAAAPSASPVLDALRRYPRTIALAAGAFLAVQVPFYILITFVISYGTDPSGLALSRTTMLVGVLVSALVQLPFLFTAAALSDRFGRRGLYMAGALFSAVWSFAVFPLIDTGSTLWIIVALSVGQIGIALMYGPQAALLAELFPTEVRYSAASLGYQLGAIVGGSLAPIIATALLAETGGPFGIAVYMALACLITLFCIHRLEETRGRALTVSTD
ncbi:MAG: MFS transporter [Gammaproteobacteria bacterium]